MFLEHQISILQRFLKDHVALKIQICHQRNKLHFKIYCNNTVLFKLIFHNIGEYKVFQHQTFELLCTLYMCYEFCDALVNII